MKLFPATMTLLLWVSACTPLPNAAVVAHRFVTVQGRVAVQVQRPHFGLLSTTRVAYTLDRLDHIEVFVQDLTTLDQLGYPFPEFSVGILPAEGEGPTEHTFAPIVLSRLKPRHDYRVVLQAFQADPAQNGNIVQVDDNSGQGCETFFNTNGEGDGEASESISLPEGFALKLADQEFVGTATGTISPIDGGLVDAEVSETVEINPE